MGKMKIAVAALAAAVTLGATGMTAVRAADSGGTGTTVPSGTRPAADDAEHQAREAQRKADFEALAALLGLDADALEARLKAGETLKQVATAQGVDVQAVIDLMVTQATARIRAEITDRVNNGRPERDGRGHGGRGPGGPRGRGMDGRGTSGQAPRTAQPQQG